jgi:hypothetical protein
MEEISGVLIGDGVGVIVTVIGGDVTVVVWVVAIAGGVTVTIWVVVTVGGG